MKNRPDRNQFFNNIIFTQIFLFLVSSAFSLFYFAEFVKIKGAPTGENYDFLYTVSFFGSIAFSLLFLVLLYKRLNWVRYLTAFGAFVSLFGLQDTLTVTFSVSGILGVLNILCLICSATTIYLSFFDNSVSDSFRFKKDLLPNNEPALNIYATNHKPVEKIDLNQRLTDLKNLYESGLITTDDYDTAKKKILDSI